MNEFFRNPRQEKFLAVIFWKPPFIFTKLCYIKFHMMLQFHK